ncbi:uncharacterized protein RJT20DRAFT_124820 [Scheffersomyces xylosifermentans]|uniref:uncharacterized protein n=1 Tax=Scheffersomyces xylosifermentans TaxID=1304137 RepID=UPI00315CFC9B
MSFIATACSTISKVLAVTFALGVLVVFFVPSAFLDVAFNSHIAQFLAPKVSSLLPKSVLDFLSGKHFLFSANSHHGNTPAAVKLLSASTTTLLVALSFYILSRNLPYNLPQIVNRVFSTMNSGYKFANRSRFASKKSKHHRYAIKNGGEVGGISNDGNTCFMNSVIQSLASSRELLKFIDSYLYSEIVLDNKDGNVVTMKSNTPKPELVFTVALKTLLDNVNGRYGSRGKEFSTKPLLNKMPNGPKQNFFSGYNQEDAQEFYQLVMRLLEREYKNVSSSRMPTPEPEEKGANGKSQQSKFVNIDSVPNLITGTERLGKLGKVYVPAYQVDPNLIDCDHKVFPLELITPVDGISAERIGCLTCGEVGGIRYSVNSGLSLNLPNNSSYYSSFNLLSLMNDWITPEIIEDVNCNRCGLNQTRDFLLETLKDLKEKGNSGKLLEQFQNRLDAIQLELAKPHIEDEVFEKLTIKKQIRKSRKSKQIYLSRPPPLLAIHINRSVFDPRTYMIVKNSSNVTFPSRLNLKPYVAEPNDINMDARLPFRKQDERNVLKNINGTNGEKQNETFPSTPSDSSLSSVGEEDSEQIKSDTTSSTDLENSEVRTPLDPKLLYNLKAVVSHYGTHNYGHYICYRKLRGTWWRISDESVYVVTENEVLSGQGTFMLFYEYDDGFQEILQDVSDSEEEEEDENQTPDDSSLQSKSVSSKMDVDSDIATAPNDDIDYEESSGLSDDDEVLRSSSVEQTQEEDQLEDHEKEDEGGISSVSDFNVAEAHVHL